MHDFGYYLNMIERVYSRVKGEERNVLFLHNATSNPNNSLDNAKLSILAPNINITDGAIVIDLSKKIKKRTFLCK